MGNGNASAGVFHAVPNQRWYDNSLTMVVLETLTSNFVSIVHPEKRLRLNAFERVLYLCTKTHFVCVHSCVHVYISVCVLQCLLRSCILVCGRAIYIDTVCW